jgi:serine/threonine protein kinase
MVCRDLLQRGFVFVNMMVEEQSSKHENSLSGAQTTQRSAAAKLAAYDVREQIGKGAFGNAFLVVHKDTAKHYVLKKIKLARQSDWQRKASFLEMTLVRAHPF